MFSFSSEDIAVIQQDLIDYSSYTTRKNISVDLDHFNIDKIIRQSY